MMWILISFLTFSLFDVCLLEDEPKQTSMRWVDHIKEDNMDIVYDRAVIILIRSNYGVQVGLSLGIFINNITVLTSFNPFRQYIKNKGNRQRVVVSVLHYRTITDWKKVQYTLKNYSIDCARQIIPVPDDEDFWMNDQKEQSPQHDLLVLRLNAAVELLDPDPRLYNFNNYGKSGVSKVQAGPILVSLATPRHKLGRRMKFASLGFLDKKHIKKFHEMRTHVFDEEDDNVETDCDSWLPREWGVFICIRNIKRLKALGSGALLVHNFMLYGMGSFLLRKGKDSILVFTDIRPYMHLFYDTCSIYDQTLGYMRTTSTTTIKPTKSTRRWG